jgi:uncharacterized protein (DUF3084 family)
MPTIYDTFSLWLYLTLLDIQNQAILLTILLIAVFSYLLWKKNKKIAWKDECISDRDSLNYDLEKELEVREILLKKRNQEIEQLNKEIDRLDGNIQRVGEVCLVRELNRIKKAKKKNEIKNRKIKSNN